MKTNNNLESIKNSNQLATYILWSVRPIDYHCYDENTLFEKIKANFLKVRKDCSALMRRGYSNKEIVATIKNHYATFTI